MAGEALTGGAKAAGEALTGAIKGAAEATAASAKAVASAKNAVEGGGLLSLLGLGNVPITITFSVVTFFAWVGTLLAAGPLVGFGFLPRLGVLVGAVLASLVASSIALRPVAKIFNTAPPASHHDMVGKLCTISSGKVEATFGTATIDDGAAGLNVHVVCGKPNTLKKGDRALLLSFDAQRELYEVEPLDWLEPAEQEALKDPARSQSVIANKIKVR